MAQIYPQLISAKERKNNPGKRAEYVVYDALNEQLGENWLVLYGFAIKWSHQYGVSDRETEFIIAHADLGVLALEIKGGSITRDGGRWYTTPIRELSKPKSMRQRDEIKNPYDQVTGAAKRYRDKIDDYISAQRLPAWSFEIATAVCFPDIDIPSDFYIASNALPETTLGRIDMNNLKDRLYQILKLHQGKSGNPPGVMGLDILKQVFARDWHFDSFIAYQLRSAGERRDKLTEEQFNLLYNLVENPKMLIRGCAGSGKTMIAIKIASRLAEQGQRVLFTCYNENLAKWLSTSAFSRTFMNITHFHKLCYDIVSGSKEVSLPSWSEHLRTDQTFSNKTMPEALELAALDIGLSYDAIIIDEGQDFKSPLWFKVLYELLSDKEKGVFYIFYDDNQRIYSQSPIPFKWFSYPLTQNMRNTNPIFEHVKSYYHQPDKIYPSGLSGPEPWFVNSSDYANEYDAVQDVLQNLVEQKISLSEIVILTPRSKENSLFGTQRPSKTGNFALLWKPNPLASQVRCETIQSFKGLESPVVILTELGHVYPSNRIELMYVATSRARDYLIVIGKLP